MSGNDFIPVLNTDGELVYNWPLNSVVIKKTHAITGELLAGAAFELYRADEQVSGVPGTSVGRFTTDNSGIIVIPALDPGYYVVKEVQAPQNFMLSENSMQNGFLKADGTTVLEFTFANYPYGSILVTKVDAQTGKPLPNARFKVTDDTGAVAGNTNGEFITDENGEFLVENLKPGAYVVTEIEAPEYYTIDTTPQTVNVGTDGKTYKVSFKNQPSGTLVIRKLDTKTKEPLSDAEFKVTDSSGAVVGTGNGIYKSDATGTITIPHLPKGSYVVQEIKAPDGYILENQSQTIQIDYGSSYTLDFYNKKMSGLQIIKIDSQTKQPLKHAQFTIYKANGERVAIEETNADGVIILDTLEPGWYKVVESKAPDGYLIDETPKDVEITANQFVKFTVERDTGEKIGTYKTDMAGKIVVPDLTEGTYIVSETIAPDGYTRDEAPKTVIVKSGKLTTVEFRNKPLSGIEIIKLDTITNAPLSGATFTVEHDTGEKIGTYKTDMAGKIVVSDLAEGTYIVSETIAPDGYTRDEAPKTVIVKSGKLTTVEFRNKPLSGIEIIKLDTITNTPLSGATFTVEHDTGEKIGTYKTDMAGKIVVSDLAEGTYIVSETIAPDGYTRDEAPQTVIVKSGKLTTVEFRNKPLSGIEIIKLDAVSKAPLMGATFIVERPTGEKIGTYKTDAAGKIIVPDLTEGTYIVSETIAPDGYILSEIPKTVTVVSGKLTTVEFTNKPLSGLKIVKLDSATRQPIEGVEFVITKMSGEKVTNDFNGYNFTTDKTGQIYIPNLDEGYYTVTETRTANGYILDGEPKTVQIQSGKPTVLEVLNTPMSGLLIVKTDEKTGKPLQGVVFDVRRADGQLVAGYIADGNQPNTEANSPNKTTSPNGDITGSYTTDKNGRILINTLPAGEYHVTERKALDGYEIDTDVHAATVTPGKLTTLQLTNKQKAGLRIIKVDSITKQPIFNVEFVIFDESGKVVGTYYTDNNGIIDFAGILTEGRYTIRETRSAEGYYADDIPKTIQFESGKYTEITWQNIPKQGQIQITKLSADDNEVNGLPAGTPLAGAIFEVYAYKSGNLVDRFISGSDGNAVSKPLPTGRYLVKEMQAPQYYRLNPKELDVEIEFATQIIKLEFTNYSANTGVYIKKVGNVEAMAGDTIHYDIKAIQNTGSVPLTDFYWRDILPVDAVRLNKIVTGTFNQSLKYKVIATTNKGDTVIIADNLSTTKNNVIDCSPASLGLRGDEFVTSFTVIFGNVKAGFCQVEQPQVYVNVLKTLPNGYQFSNKADVGGKYGSSEWVVGNSTCVTTIYRGTGDRLPKTGY